MKKKKSCSFSSWVEGYFPLLVERCLRNIISLLPQHGCYLCHPLLPRAQGAVFQFKCERETSRISKKDILFKLRSKEQNLEKIHGTFWKQTQACTPNQMTMSQFQSESRAVNVSMVLNPRKARLHLSRAYQLSLTAKVFHFSVRQPSSSQPGARELTYNCIKIRWRQTLKHPWFYMCLFLISHFEFTIEMSSIYKELFLVDLIPLIFKQNFKESGKCSWYCLTLQWGF